MLIKFYVDIIRFDNNIIIDKERSKGECRCYYKIYQWKETVKIDILNVISNHVNLVQFMDSIRNVNHAVSISGCWIYYSDF